MALENQSDASYILNEVINRLRTLEGKYSLIAEKTLLINKNMIEEHKVISKHVRLIESDMRDLKLEVGKLKETIKDIAKDLDGYARKENLKVLEKYINLMDPLKSITEDDVKRIVEEVIKSEQK